MGNLRTLCVRAKQLFVALAPSKKIIATLVTASVAGVATSLVLNPISGLVSATVVFAHEVAHGMTASYYGGNWNWTVIIPLGVMMFGVTQISSVPLINKRIVYAIGPIIGLMVACLFLFVGIVINHQMLIAVAITVCLAEIYQGFLGSDGRKARKYKLV